MRQTFDRKMPVWQQRLRVMDAKQPGRKHQKRKGAKAKERDKATAKRRAQLNAVFHRKFHEAVRAYYAGNIDCYPAKPKRR